MLKELCIEELKESPRICRFLFVIPARHTLDVLCGTNSRTCTDHNTPYLFRSFVLIFLPPLHPNAPLTQSLDTLALRGTSVQLRLDPWTRRDRRQRNCRRHRQTGCEYARTMRGAGYALSLRHLL